MHVQNGSSAETSQACFSLSEDFLKILDINLLSASQHDDGVFLLLPEMQQELRAQIIV
jgi:hypothetical protein